MVLRLMASAALAAACLSCASPPSPSVAGVVLDGLGSPDRVELASFAGRPVVVNNFASWCAPCVKELPAFERTYQDVRGKVEFLGVAVRDDPKAALDLVARTGVSFGVAADPDGHLAATYGGTGMPSTLFVDASGKVVGRRSGEVGRRELRTLIRKHFAV